MAAVLASAALKQAATASRRHYAQTEADQQRRIVETFTKAIEQLGSDKLEVRVGAIFALERISNESSYDYWTIMEVLTAFVRERMRYTIIEAGLRDRAYLLWEQAGGPEGRTEEFWFEAVRLERRDQPLTDIFAILTVIGRRSAENQLREEDRGWRLDLGGTCLTEFNQQRISLKQAVLYGAHLERAILSDAHLEGALFVAAHLEGAYLLGTHLERARLADAHLEEAKLHHAHLEGADLVGAHLERAILMGAHLERAILMRAHLEGASLSDAHLEGASLAEAIGLTSDQLCYAHGDRNTILPEGIGRPKNWPPPQTQP